MKPDRIAALDGLRGVAILAVVAFHFYYSAAPPRTTRTFYPYDPIEWLRFGRYGVELFFIISGFVISMTLARCQSVQEFAVKRFARLWPSMALCSVVTFLVLSLPGAPLLQPNSLKNFLPSLTFIDPRVWSAVTGERFYWMDRAYWSLFVEVQFYALAALVYFFPWRIVPGVLALALGWSILSSLPWFLIGVGLYRWGKPEWWTWGPLKVLAWTPLTMIGAASYSLYLLHQHIGLALIASVPELGYAAPVLVTACMIAVSLAVYRYWEQPWNRRIMQARSPLAPPSPWHRSAPQTHPRP